jgi:2-polyprenyl-3-methyl-5-hydroxy-6-metoxy-1,4-benzoquinol methylase
MNNMNFRSPVTHSKNIHVTKKIKPSKIIELYKKNYNIDVSPYFESIEFVKIIRCKDTGFRFYYPPKLEGSNILYEELQNFNGPSNYYAEWRWEHEFALKFLRSQDRVLDIGCGSGNYILKAKSTTNNIIGLEYNDLALRACKERNLTVYNTPLKDFSEIPENKTSFDIICAFQVLEHVYDVHSFISCCLNLLHKGGRLIVGVPNNNPYLYKYDLYHTLNLPPHHIGLWNKVALTKLQKFYPLKLELLQVEPNINFEYWLNIQGKRFIGLPNISKILRKLKVYHKVSLLSRFTEGRNLISVYIKD